MTFSSDKIYYKRLQIFKIPIKVIGTLKCVYTMRQNSCDKIALCKRAYLCDMRLLHADAGKLKSSNFLATIACRNKPVYMVRF